MRIAAKPLVLALAAIGVGQLAVFAPMASAQTAPAPQKIEKIEVTGSNIKRTDTETASAVEVITVEDIKRSGATTVTEVLRNVSAASGGGLADFDVGTGFSPGVASISLRGLGSTATLVLLNGRRIAPAANADPNAGQSTTFNLNSIPLSAVERIEVLKDGASAIYGSDAMAGVVNIILKRDYNGAEAAVGFSRNSDNHFGSWRASGAIGFGDLAKDRYNALITFEHFKRDRTTLKDAKDVAADDYSRLYGRIGTLSSRSYYPNFYRERTAGSGVFNTLVGPDSRCPANQVQLGLCRYDQWANLSAQSEKERNSVLARGTFEVTSNLQLFGEFGFSRVEDKFTSSPPLADNVTSTWYAQDGRRFQWPGFVLPVGHPDNPHAFPVMLRYRFADLGPSLQKVETDTVRTVFGAKGSIGKWDLESAFLYNKAENTDKQNGFLHYPTLQQVIADRSYRPAGQNSADVLGRLNPGVTSKGETKITQLDVKASSELAELAGGPLAIALGAEARKEELKVVPDSRVVNGEFVGLGGSQANGSRNVKSMFAELSIPFAKGLETQVALRYDHYSDFGNSTTPKVGIKWTPTGSFALRGTYAKGFRAPALAQISQANVQVFNTISDPVRCNQPGADREDCTGRSISSLIRANADLKPEKSDSFTLGMVFSPTRDVNLTVDFYEIRRKDEVNRFTSQYIINREGQFPGAVFRDPNQASWIPGIPNSGPILSTVRQFFNLGETRTRGIDFDGEVKASLGDMGRLKTRLSGSYLINFRNSFQKGDRLIEYQGGEGPFGPLPRFRGSLSSTWTYANFDVTGTVNYTGGWYYGSDGSCDDTATFEPAFPNCRVKPWTTLDLGVSYSGIKNLTMGLVVRNLQDKPAPFYPGSTTLGFNTDFHNPYGRNFSGTVSYKFF